MQRRRGESAARTEISWASSHDRLKVSLNRFASTSFRSQFRDFRSFVARFASSLAAQLNTWCKQSQTSFEWSCQRAFCCYYWPFVNAKENVTKLSQKSFREFFEACKVGKVKGESGKCCGCEWRKNRVASHVFVRPATVKVPVTLSLSVFTEKRKKNYLKIGKRALKGSGRSLNVKNQK